jgi:tRNA(Arg) A34 adenosine deaminase TadA
MSLSVAVQTAIANPIKPIGRNSISRFGAVLTDGRQFFYGQNTYKTHPLQAKYGVNSESVHVHAEISAIIQALNWKARQKGTHYRNKDICDLSDFTLYVARVLKNGQPANAKPCEGCMSAIKEFGIREIYWTE